MREFATTPVLRIAYESGGPADGAPVLLLHGWPDDVRTYDAVAPALQAAGFRTIAPYLRGFGPTTFLSAETMRSGEIVAMAQDALDLADALGLDQFAVAGHDWGARIAYALAAAAPQRVTRIATISVPWDPGALTTPGLVQAQAYWYQWFMATDRGAEAVRAQGKAFARHQWETWGPPHWFTDAAFETTATSFENPDWPEITLHSYRVRWGEAEPDSRYSALDARVKSVRTIGTPTMMIHGGADRCTLPASTEGKEKNFTGGYVRHVLDGVGHFPTREAADAVNALLLAFLTR
jgi:pimeloyl-ACP methyl ester carboxylesterase